VSGTGWNKGGLRGSDEEIVCRGQRSKPIIVGLFGHTAQTQAVRIDVEFGGSLIEIDGVMRDDVYFMIGCQAFSHRQSHPFTAAQRGEPAIVNAYFHVTTNRRNAGAAAPLLGP